MTRFLQSAAHVISGVINYLVRNNEINLLNRLNDQLVIENNRYHEMLREERAKYDELKLAFDKHLGLTKLVDTTLEEIEGAIGGFTSYSKKASKLSLASRRKLDAEDSGD